MTESYTVQSNYPVTQNVTTKEYHLPFFIYNKTVTEDASTGKKRVEKSFKVKDQQSLITDAVLVTVSAGAINAIGNGLAHLIYACKKKKNKK
jgi:hypothetical protein